MSASKSKPTNSRKSKPKPLRELSLVDLIFYRDVVKAMQKRNCNIREGCKVACENRFTLNVAEDKFKAVRCSLSLLIGADPIEEIGGVGRHQLVTKNTAILRKLEDVIEQINAIDEATSRIELQKERFESSEVRIGTIVSIVNYLGPALILKIRSDAEHHGKPIPHIAMHHGEFGRHLDMLIDGKLDFLIHYFTRAHLPPGVASVELRYKAMERGIVFRRYLGNEKRYAFPNLIKALEAGNMLKFIEELDDCPILLFHGSDGPPDVLRNKLHDKFVRPSGRSRATGGQRIFMPTMRSERQLIQMGLGIGFSHKPLVKSRKPIKHNCSGIEIINGFDPEFPGVELVYVPLSVLDQEGKPTFKTDPLQFGLFLRSNDGKTDLSNLHESAKAVCEAIQSIIESPDSKYGYLEFSNSEKGEPVDLLHSFHFAGFSATNR